MRHFNLYLRTFKELFSQNKKAYLLQLVKAISEESGIFINILYMARILNELATTNYQLVKASVVEYLIIFASLQLIGSIVSPILEDEKMLVRRTITKQPYEKMTRMNFHYADQADTHEKLHQISREMVQNNSSVLQISQHLYGVIENCVSLLWSLVLLMPLWRGARAQIATEWLWVNSPWLTILLALMVIVSVFLQTQLMQRVYATIKTQGENTREINALYYYLTTKLYDSENGKEIRLYKLQDSIKLITQQHTKKILAWYKDYYGKSQTAVLISNLTSQLLTLCLYGLIGLRVLVGGLPIALIVQLSGALSQLISTLPQLLSFLSIFSQAEPLERYYEFMDYPEEEIKGSLHVEKRLDNQYSLEVNQLYFTYPSASDYTLSDVSQAFEVGKKYAIVGENGSGKTTFIKVLMRLYEATEGEVLLNRIHSTKYNLSEYYQLFSVVFQDYRLLSFTLGQNMAVNQVFDEPLSRKIIKEVGLDSLLEKMPNGLHTFLGQEFEDDGVNLSGGQAQKVAMGRALYKDAPIMILDEPTAALDPVAEFEIYQKFSQIAEGKTAFYISHRLSSCRFCDEVLVFDKGKIVQRGNHDTLVKEAGKYQELWQAQAQYYS